MYSTFISKKSPYKNHDYFLRYAPLFYEAFPQDYNIKIQLPVHVLARDSYLELLRQLNRCRNSNILIVSHASIDGLYLSINSTKLKWHVMAAILLYAKLEKKHISLLNNKNAGDPKVWSDTIANEATKPLNLYTAKQSLQTLYNKKETSGKKKFDEFIRRNYEKEIDKTKKDQIGKQLIQKMDNQVKNRFKKLLRIARISKKNMDSYVKEINKIYQMKRTIEIRGCNIGKSPDVLRIMCLFFNAQSINAPNVKIFFGEAKIIIQNNQAKLHHFMKVAIRRYVSSHLTHTKTDYFWIGGPARNINKNRNQHALYYHPRYVLNSRVLDPHKDELLFVYYRTSTEIIAEDISIVRKFAIDKFGRPAPNKAITNHTKKLYIQTTITQPFHFPQDNDFANHLVKVFNPGNFNIN